MLSPGVVLRAEREGHQQQYKESRHFLGAVDMAGIVLRTLQVLAHQVLTPHCKETRL